MNSDMHVIAHANRVAPETQTIYDDTIWGMYVAWHDRPFLKNVVFYLDGYIFILAVFRKLCFFETMLV